MKARCLVLLPFLLSACTMQAPKPAMQETVSASAPLAATPGNETEQLLDYHQMLLPLSHAELLKVFDKLMVRPADARNAVQKAMVLALLGRKGDFAQAQLQLQSVLSESSVQAQALKPLATMLMSSYAASQKLQEQLERSNRQLADNQNRIEQLTRMLDQLKAIERALPARLGSVPAPGAEGGKR